MIGGVVHSGRLAFCRPIKHATCGLAWGSVASIDATRTPAGADVAPLATEERPVREEVAGRLPVRLQM